MSSFAKVIIKSRVYLFFIRALYMQRFTSCFLWYCFYLCVSVCFLYDI